ncbi:MAG: hypothetical protein OXB93_04110 [Cytophagales bacterium]|nr:hypothetical protein [Cytophagales bacterium]
MFAFRYWQGSGFFPSLFLGLSMCILGLFWGRLPAQPVFQPISCNTSIHQETLHGLATKGYQMIVPLPYKRAKKSWWKFLSALPDSRVFFRHQYWLIQFWAEKTHVDRRKNRWYTHIERRKSEKPSTLIYLGAPIQGRSEVDIAKQVESIRAFLNVFEVRVQHDLLEEMLKKQDTEVEQIGLKLQRMQRRKQKMDDFIKRREKYTPQKEQTHATPLQGFLEEQVYPNWLEEYKDLSQKIPKQYKILQKQESHRIQLLRSFSSYLSQMPNFRSK